MARAKPAKTISDIFKEFLADQKARISHKTFLKYQSIRLHSAVRVTAPSNSSLSGIFSRTVSLAR